MMLEKVQKIIKNANISIVLLAFGTIYFLFKLHIWDYALPKVCGYIGKILYSLI